MMGYEVSEEGEVKELPAVENGKEERPTAKLRRLKEAMHLASKEVRLEVRREAEEKVQEEFRLHFHLART